MTYARLSGALLACKDAPPVTTIAKLVPAHSVEPAPAVAERLNQLARHLKALKLPTFLCEYYDKLARQCADEGLDHSRHLLRLAELELTERKRQGIKRLIKQARFPAAKVLDGFDFAAVPSLDGSLVRDLAQCGYVAQQENIIAIGDSGTGKTHVALGLGVAACQNGLSVRFYTAASLVRELIEAGDKRRLLFLQRRLAACKVLIIDELGYVPLPTAGAALLFEVISQRYERGSTIITSNLPLDEWNTVFGPRQLTGALLDRLTHRVHILEMNGRSYRLTHGNARQPHGHADGVERAVTFRPASPL